MHVDPAESDGFGVHWKVGDSSVGLKVSLAQLHVGVNLIPVPSVVLLLTVVKGIHEDFFIYSSVDRCRLVDKSGHTQFFNVMENFNTEIVKWK